MPKKITVISQDYDNCFAIMTQEGFNAEFYGRNKATWESEFIAKGVDIVARTESTREQYNAYLTAITRDANAVRVYVGSDRQSDDLDKLNAAKNGNGSVFPALETLCREKSTVEQPWQFEPLLLADPLIPGAEPYLRARGEAYRRISESREPQLRVTERPTMFTNNEGRLAASKRSMLLNQMWDAYRQNPDADALDFHFIDDREDLINDILTRLNPADMPPNMTLKVSKFDYLGMLAYQDPEALKHCGTIVSTRPSPRLPVAAELMAEDETGMGAVSVVEVTVEGTERTVVGGTGVRVTESALSVSVLAAVSKGGPGFYTHLRLEDAPAQSVGILPQSRLG